jgi:hypothetical protein
MALLLAAVAAEAKASGLTESAWVAHMELLHLMVGELLGLYVQEVRAAGLWPWEGTER